MCFVLCVIYLFFEDMLVNFILFLAIPMTLGLIIISDYFVPIFFGTGYEKVTILLKIISPMLIIVGLNNVTGTQFLLPTKKQKEFTIAVVIGALVNFILNLIFIPLWQSIGASITSLLAEFVALAIELYYCRQYINIKGILKEATKKIFAGVIMFVITILIPYICNDLYTLVIKVFVGIVTYLIILLLMKDEFMKFLIKKLVHKNEKQIEDLN